MLRFLLSMVFLTVVLAVLVASGVLPPALHAVAAWVLYATISFGLPLLLVLYFLAPGLFRRMKEQVSQFWARVRSRRREVEGLRRKIAHLEKPHHMVQLGNLYMAQGRVRKAAGLFQQALDKDPELIEAQYKLALCYYRQGKYQQAAQLLEQVHAAKPEHDYGMAYLRLAQSRHRCGEMERAEEVYQLLLRFYPGHAEGSYHFALLLADEGEWSRACELMRDVISTVRLSPGFQRRRNRHWLLKARWWLLRHGKV